MIYKIALARTYVVTIEAENEDDARTLSEFYLGDCPDLSSEEHQNERKFSIKVLKWSITMQTKFLKQSKKMKYE